MSLTVFFYWNFFKKITKLLYTKSKDRDPHLVYEKSKNMANFLSTKG